MRFSSLILVLLVALTVCVNVSAQSPAGAAERADVLRARLLETQAKEAELEARARQLDEDIKPENIERSLAGIGSTRPEELREQRRRQLAIERDGVRAQLKLLAANRERLEAAIRGAEGLAYQQSADSTTPPVSQALIAQNASSRWLFPAILVAAAIGLMISALAFLRRRSAS